MGRERTRPGEASGGRPEHASEGNTGFLRMSAFLAGLSISSEYRNDSSRHLHSAARRCLLGARARSAVSPKRCARATSHRASPRAVSSGLRFEHERAAWTGPDCRSREQPARHGRSARPDRVAVPPAGRREAGSDASVSRRRVLQRERQADHRDAGERLRTVCRRHRKPSRRVPVRHAGRARQRAQLSLESRRRDAAPWRMGHRCRHQELPLAPHPLRTARTKPHIRHDDAGVLPRSPGPLGQPKRRVPDA